MPEFPSIPHAVFSIEMLVSSTEGGAGWGWGEVGVAGFGGGGGPRALFPPSRWSYHTITAV